MRATEFIVELAKNIWYHSVTKPLELLSAHFKKRRNRIHIKHLRYAMTRLMKPYHDDIDERDREYRLEAVNWLHQFYLGNPDFVGDGPPEIKLKKILSKPTRDVTLRDHVYTKVFYYWKEYKRVEGF